MNSALNPPSVMRALESALELGEVGLQMAAYRGDGLIVDARAGDTDRGLVDDTRPEPCG